MDCPTCHGNGEMENIQNSEEQFRMKEKEMSVRIRERGFWPYACPVCGGSGYLED